MTDRKLLLCKTEPHPCSYLPRRSSSVIFANLYSSENAEHYEILTSLGFRRSGSCLYIPHCADCQACIPLRIKVQDFKPQRRDRRIMKRNQSVQVEEKPARLTQETLELYQNYIAARHNDGNMHPADAQQFNDFLLSGWSDTRFLEFRLPEKNDLLIAVAVTDWISNAMLSIYTFFNPDYQRQSLGAFSILSQIKRAQEDGLDFLYLGYWIEQCGKMSYKNNYRPHQLLLNKRWIEVS